MCGIAGVLSKCGGNVAPLVGSMLFSMASRGPDGAGVSFEGKVIRSESVADLELEMMTAKSVIGHSRLAIVGGTCGTQPFRSCDGRFTLEHNGEIYNYKELKARIKDRHTFLTETDSEVIIHLLEEHFISCHNFLEAVKRTVAELDGVYALAIRDEKENTTVLARDRLGVRPMYYAENEQMVAFASERKALWAVGLKEPTLRVLPGHALVIEGANTQPQVQIAGLLPARVIHRTMTSAVAAYEKALIAAMKKRTQDVQRIGIIFSGGIDSVLV